MKISYNWLKWYIPEIPNADKLADILTYHLTEVEDVEKLPDGDTIFDLNILPNRAHDLLSHSGVAREISGQLGIAFTDPTKTYKDILAKKEIKPTNLKVDVQTQNCRRFSARIIRGIKVGPSPDWVVKHLESVGQRSINNIVDATNLVMLNCGQPTHAFDLRKFSDQKIIIKNAEGAGSAKEDEELTLVGREQIVAKLKDTDTVIANSSLETLSLAGIKGGVNSGITDDTTDIVIEVANFDPVSVRKTARRIGVLSDAAKRFENDLSPELCDFGMLELSALLAESGNPERSEGLEFEDIIDIYPQKQESKTITFSLDYVNKILGADIKKEEVERILENYNYASSESQISGPRVSSPDAEILNPDSAVFCIKVPPLRLDLNGPHDMAEEIGRIYGYDKIKSILPSVQFASKENQTYTQIKKARNNLVLAGYREVMTYSFTKRGEVQVARGTKGKDFLRTNLLDGLKESYELNKNNAPLLGLAEIKIFEIGTVFVNNKEEIHVAFVDKKEAKEFNLNEVASLETNLLGPRVSSPDHNKSLPSYAAASQVFSPWSQYPFITRDVSVWVPKNIPANDVLENIKNSINELVVYGPSLFDTFSKDGRNSYAFRLVFQANDRTLTDEEISPVMQKIEDGLKQIKDLELR